MKLFTAWSWRPVAKIALALSLGVLMLGSPAEAAYQLDTSSLDSVKTVASSMTKDMMSFYTGNKPGGTPGLLPSPYYWWEAGALMGALIDYWYYTGDTTYNDIATQGLLFQVGPNNDYMPPNQTMTEGNDDQGFWGLAVMSAAEYNFPDPPADKPQWLALAQAVFNTQVARWDKAECNGGLRWQIFTWNNGFDYKNSISQACFFNIAARLALYTGNKTYADWAETTWNWMRGVKLIDDNYYVYDGGHIQNNCTEITPYQFSYNAGAFLLGAAAMYNYTSLINDQEKAANWREQVNGLINGTYIFFQGNQSNIMTEIACEPVNLCDLDQQSFKAYLSRWMAATTKWAPWTYDTIIPLLRASSEAAAGQCTGGDNGRMCGLKWANNNGTWDGTTGVGQQMAAMEVTLSNMIQQVTAPVTNTTGGTSQGDPNAGSSDVGRTDPFTALEMMHPIRTGDRVGAAILTVFVLGCFGAGVIYLLIDETIDRTPSERFQGAVAAVGKGSKRLMKRNRGDGLGGPMGAVAGAGFSEKGQQLGHPIQSFKVIDRSDSDRSSSVRASSERANNLLASQRRTSIRFSGPPAAVADLEKGHRDSIIEGHDEQQPLPVFASVHLRGSARGRSRVSHHAHMSDPGQPTPPPPPARDVSPPARHSVDLGTTIGAARSSRKNMTKKSRT